MHHARKHKSTQAAALRAGTVLLIVLVVVALLALGAYTFAEIMTVEANATATFGREVQARAAADSGIDLVASLLQKRYLPDAKSYYNEPHTLEGVLLADAKTTRGRSRFSVVTGNEFDTSGRSVRFGISDESSKLNLNTMMKLVAAGTIQASVAEGMLMAFPEMTLEIADAILDWMDTNTTPMQSGVETEYYQGLTPPYPAKDNLLDSLDELLLVKGVTPQLLFGEDTNHNGILDPNENDGANSLPLDNADGVLQRGWSAFWTVYSREMNLRSDGKPRTNVNQSDLTQLYNQISTDFDEKTATFILAYRVNGPSSSGGGGQSGNGTGGGGGGSGSGGSGGLGGGGGSGGSKSSSGGGSSSSGGGSSNSGGKSSSGSSSSGGSKSSSSGGSGGSSKSSSSGSQGSGSNQQATTPVLVGGIDISKGASYTIVSLFELPGARTQAMVNSVQTQLTSPWQASPTDALAQSLPLIMDKLTLTDAPYIEGRININTAPREVLLSLVAITAGGASGSGGASGAGSASGTGTASTASGAATAGAGSGSSGAGTSGITETMVDAIYGAQPHKTGSSGTDVPADRLNTGWLVVNNVVSSINDLEKIDPLITGRGDVFHVQSVGYFEGGGPMARVEAVIDATQDPPQVVFMRDLTELGRGFSASLLTTGR